MDRARNAPRGEDVREVLGFASAQSWQLLHNGLAETASETCTYERSVNVNCRLRERSVALVEGRCRRDCEHREIHRTKKRRSRSKAKAERIRKKFELKDVPKLRLDRLKCSNELLEAEESVLLERILVPNCTVAPQCGLDRLAASS